MNLFSQRFDGQVVVVTGASSGVGRAVAEAFGAAGARVALLARTHEALAHAASTIEQSGGEALVLPTDVSDADAVERAAAAVESRWGAIDVWVNDAMVSVFAPAAEVRDDEYRRVTEVNYLGTVHGTQAALRRMTARDAGVVIQIGSALAYCSIPLQSAYCASKAAIRGYTDSVRIELRHAGSRVKLCMLQLPAVNTPQFDVVRSRLPNRPQPVPPIFQPEVIARAVLHAAARKPREMWLGVPAWKAILGRFFAPRITEWYLARNGFDAQQTDERQPPHLPDDLDAPIPGDRGSHGRFDACATPRSRAIWLQTHPWIAASILGALAGSTALAVRR
jgi:NADP-dependent 3-hydroxy acid dehydrogenase YdfG